MRFSICVLAFSCAFTTCSVSAQELPEPFLNGNPEAAILRRPQSAGGQGARWRQQSDVSLMDGSKTEAIAIQDMSDTAFRKTFVLRCLEGRTAIALAGFPRLRQGDRVMYRVGTGAPATAPDWRVTDDLRFIGLWQPANATAFAKMLLAEKTLAVRVLGPAAGLEPEPNDAQFNLEGMGKAAAGVRAACKW